LLPGHHLKITDLSPAKLVKFQSIVDVIYKQNGIFLTAKAKAQRSGKYGDTISLSMLGRKETIFGKIIDFNKVIIQ
jgi:flagella basal body P-ring formation protein FlgA